MRALLALLALTLATPCYALAETPAPPLAPAVAPPRAVAAPVAAPAPTPAATPAPQEPDPLLKRLDSVLLKDWQAEPTQTHDASELGTPQLPPPPQLAIDMLREYRPSSIITKKYSRTQRAVTVYIFTFPDVRWSYGAYSACRIGSSNVVIRGDLSSESDQYIDFLKGTRFVVIYSQVAEDDMSKQAASNVADQLVATIDERIDSYRFLQQLPYLDRMPNTERILAGPISARKYMPIPSIQSLRVQDARQALAADYQFPHPDPDRVKAMLIDYGNPTTAFNIYTEYSDRLARNYKSRMLTSTMQASKTGETYMLCGYAGTRVFIVAGAHRKISLQVLGRQFGGVPQY